MADESQATDAGSSPGNEKASNVRGLGSSSPLPSKSTLWSALRNYFGAMLFGMALGVELDVALTTKLGWRPEDYKAHMLSSLLILASLAIENLRLRKKSK